MADYKVTDTELTSIANAIRTKGGTQAALEFPTGFVSAVQAIPTGGNIETNGLIMYLDGKNNTGSGHDGTASTWHDLSGNGNNGIITGGVWGSDELQFDGSTWVNCGENNNQQFTVEVLARWDSFTPSLWGSEAISNLEAGGFGIYLDDGVIAFVASDSGTYKTLDYMAPNIGQYYLVTAVIDANNVYLYINGARYTSQQFDTIKYPINNTVIALGVNPNGSSAGGEWFVGRIKAARLYNRALSYSEITGNFLHDVQYYSL